MTGAPVLQTERFVLRPLGLADVGERYLSWFGDPAAARISAQATTRGLEDLRRYVADRIDRLDVLFLGIFERSSLLHVGNIKFEPVDREQGYAVLGIFIGEAAYRGKGITAEVIATCGGWLKAEGIREVVLGVEMDNHGAIRAYEKAGFRISDTDRLPVTPNVHRMVLTL
ncbi:MAG: GNAT family N-acetyltransferase [Cypionkella sp.]